MRLNELSLKVRLGWGFGVVLALTALIAALGWLQLSQARTAGHTILNTTDQAFAAQRWQALTSINVARTLAIAKSEGHEGVRQHFEPLMKATSADITALQKQLESQATDEDKKLFEDVVAKRTKYIESRNAIFGLLDIGDPGAMEALDSVLMPAAKEYLAAIEAYDRTHRELARAKVAASDASMALAQWWLLGLTAVCLVLGGVMAYVMASSVIKPLLQVARVTREMAAGDLTHDIRPQGSDEAAKTLYALADMQAALQKLVSDVREASESITIASSEVAAGSQDLSGRTEQAASNLQQTASSMEQISGTVQHSSEAAHTANQLAAGAASAAGAGGDVVGRVVSTMDAISDGSRRIADIIGVIDSIAFQTNILALNAAVEAARAGEQGRGFAVVASEVRALAHRVAEAAKEVKSLIGASVEQVNAGSTLVHEAGASMAQIVDAVQRVSDVIGEISAAATEQSDGIRQINQAVNHLDQMTQQNAALVEESAAAAESLKDQAARLSQVVSGFRLPA
jgi:methyl-accepting chemotaxis protein